MGYFTSRWQLTSGQLISRSWRFVVLIAISTAVLGAILLGLWRLASTCPGSGFCSGVLKYKTAIKQLHISDTSPASDDLRHAISPSPSSAPAPQQISGMPPVPTRVPTKGPCEGFPDTSKILLIMKTGASELFARIPTQLLMNLRCVSDFLIFGDMEQTVAGYHVQDSLDEVREEARANNPDFDLYFRQKNCASDQETCNRNTNDNTAAQAWNPDKYKNIHIAEKTWRQRPNYDWYLYVDADTYVAWPTVVEWLQRVNPKEQWYIGSVAFLGDFPFAHGGSGYLLSQATMKSFFDGKTDVSKEWDLDARIACCVVNGEKPSMMSYGKAQWCQPIVTMHHVSSEEVTGLHEFEIERDFTSPLRFRDLYHRFIEQLLEDKREGWDNLSEDVFYLYEKAREYSDWQLQRTKKGGLSSIEREAHLGFDQCQRACHNDPGCFQFRLNQGICAMSNSIKHGRPRKPETKDDEWLSGWDVPKINRWVQDNSNCGKITWPSVHN
ncbi:unnamed protein product [Clonostachys chloroleuca]|uniref:N-acetylgalactosaminide beta-1,3-galactosyltransferase n=1 Tax=Clonostachys chloroleuca TaxID=1926264 RepID=A0AA35MHH0_9HYPO|nr:unnamed protein product [Clonostachys chloroleuca]